MDGCQDALIEGVTGIGNTRWNIVPGNCERVTIRRINLISWLICTDGIDVVGSRDVLIEDCFLRNNDDCVAIKAFDPRPHQPHIQTDWGQDVRNVVVQRCVLYNHGSGNVLEIGYETRTSRIHDIVFHDCDVIGSHGFAAVFSIHLGDRARVENVRYENIRVEHFYNKLVDFRIMNSRYSRDAVRGQVCGVTFRNIRARKDIYNCISLIGGYDVEHRIENVLFDDFMIGDQPVTNAEALHLFTNAHTGGITFR